MSLSIFFSCSQFLMVSKSSDQYSSLPPRPAWTENVSTIHKMGQNWVQNGSKIIFFEFFFGEFLTIIDAATCACQQLDDLPTPIEILIISCFKTHLPLADKERIRRLRGATKTWWWQVVTFISARQFSVCCLIFVTYATYDIGVGFLLRCEKIPK